MERERESRRRKRRKGTGGKGKGRGWVASWLLGMDAPVGRGMGVLCIRYSS